MRNPTDVLNSLSDKSKNPEYRFQRLYRNLYNPDFYLLAYKNIYANGGSMACFRQSLGEEDNSGDWNEYPAKESFTVNGCAVTLKGEADSYTLAIWQDGTYSYSLSLSAGQPASVWESIVEGVA